MQRFPTLPALARCTLAAALTLVATAPAAHAQTFTNATPISIPAAGSATPYPGTIFVSGGPASISYVSVTLNSFSHTFASDVHVMLVSPGGQKILLMANSNGNGRANDATLTFIPDGSVTLPLSSADVVSGVYACSVYASPTFPAPAPAGPYGTSLAPLIGTNANGTWNLYVWDRLSPDAGSFAGGWSIAFNQTPPQPTTTSFTYQGRLDANGAPITGDANVRFTLCDNATVATTIAAVAPPLTRNFTGITNGLITTALDFGPVVDTPQALWLSIEVETPASPGFVTLSPRQQVTPTPHARVAQVAATATTATTAITATQLAPGRLRIRGDSGASTTSPGIWFASPVATPINRSLVGQRDDSNVGFYNVGWSLLVNANGNTVLGDSSGDAPPERLTVNGSIQIDTITAGSPNRLNFGPIGDFAGTAENSDAVFFQRINTLVAGANTSTLRLALGDDGLTPVSVDAFSIGYVAGSSGTYTERLRFQTDGTALKPGGGSWAALSDPRAKHDIAPLSGTLDKLLHLRGYSFLYNDDRIAQGLARPGTQIGLMADEVATVFPDWVSTDAAGTRYVTERATTALMVEALRDLRAEKDRQIEALKADAAKRDAEATRRDAENAELKVRLAAIEAALSLSNKDRK